MWLKRKNAPPLGIPEFAGMSMQDVQAVLQRCWPACSTRLRAWLTLAIIGACAVAGAFVGGSVQLLFGPDSDLWPIALGSIAFGAFLGVRLAEAANRPNLRRMVRRELGLSCRICDYDLTGNVSGICPECGTPITAKGRP